MRTAWFARMLCLVTSSLAGAETVVPDATLDQRISDELGVATYTLQRLDLDAQLGQPFQIAVSIHGVEHTIDLAPRSVRAPGFKVLVPDGNGGLSESPAPPSRTYRGSDDHGSTVAASLLESGLEMLILLPERRAISVQPLTSFDPDADPALFVVYDAEDILPTNHACGGFIDVDGLEPVNAGVMGPQLRGTSLKRAEIGIDADFQFYQANGSNEANTIADVELVMNNVNIIYERDISLTFEITATVVRTSSAENPYSTNVSETLLDQFRIRWRTGPEFSIPRDLAHLFTGRNLSGTTIGIAYAGVVCNINLHYGLSQSRFSGNLNSRAALTAHEIGHNFNSGHCSGGSCHIMCAGLGGCGGIGNPPFFGNSSINVITNYSNAIACLDDINVVLPLPFSEPFDTIDPDVWPELLGATVNADADNEPSPTTSLHINDIDWIESLRLEGSTALSQTTFVEFYTQHKGVENGESLLIEYTDIAQAWQTLTTITSDGVDQTEFDFHSMLLPFQGFHDNLQIRITGQGNEGNDSWYIDDFYVGPFQGIAPPFNDDFESGIDTLMTWENVNGAATTTDADNEPSPTNSLELEQTDSIETFNVLMSGQAVQFYIYLSTQHKGVEAGESLLVEYLNINSNWVTLDTITSDGSDQTNFVFHEIIFPLLGLHDGFKLRLTAQGDESNDVWYVDDVIITSDQIDPPCPADLAAPFGTLDFFDVLEYLSLFDDMDPAADLAAPFGTFDFFDVLEFLSQFDAGC